MRHGAFDWTVRVLAAGLCLAAAPGAARAQDREPSMFAKGTWTLDLYGHYSHSISKEDAVASGVVGGSYYFAERHAVRAEAVGYFLDNDEHPRNAAEEADSDDAIAGGLNVGLRWHFLERGRFTLFVEGVAGMHYARRNFPQGGTHFNFNEQAGLGATFLLEDHVHLVGGIRYLHMSNARIRGEDENPSFDGLGGFFGVTFTY